MSGRSGFSLIELLVVMGIVILLTGVLLPSLAGVPEGARKLVCASNLHQIGLGLVMYHDEHKDRLPFSYFGVPPSVNVNPVWNEHGVLQPQEMMTAHRGGQLHTGWDGLGLLLPKGYCSAECLYCPSHTGDHPFSEYAADFENQTQIDNRDPIFINYQYAGHRDWTASTTTPMFPRRDLRRDSTVLVTDGLRSASDFSHRAGINVLRADLAVGWQEDLFRDIYNNLPPNSPLSTHSFGHIWSTIEHNTDPAQNEPPIVAP